MSRFFIDRPVFAWVVALFIILGGILALPELPISQYPNVAPPSISVSASYPGATSQTVADSVTSLIEQELNGVKGLMYYESTSDSYGNVNITLTFQPGTNPDMAQVDVQNRIKAVESRLPQAVLQQGLQVEQASSGFLLFAAFTSDNPDYDQIALGDFIARNILDEIRRVPGVGKVRMFTTERALRVWLDPSKLVGFNMTPSDVVAAIAAQNAQVTAGSLGALPSNDTQQVTTTIVVEGQLGRVEEFGDILLRSNPDGSQVFLKDVARVEIAGQMYQSASRLNGKPSAAFGVQLSPGANALATSKAVRQRLDELRSLFPAGVDGQVRYDTAPFVEASIKKVLHTLVEAVVLVFLVMFVFLQSLRYTVIPAIVVPIALMGTLLIMLLLGFSINVLTMFGMVLAIGILVDDAIVVVENVERIMAEEGLPPKEATRKAMGQISGAIIGITLVLSAVFIPMAFMSGSVGIIYQQFALSVAVSILFSAFLALSLTPALCATLLKPIKGHHERGGFFGWFNRLFERVTNRYVKWVDRILARRIIFMLGYFGIVALVFVLFVRLPSSFLPIEDQGYLIVNMQAQPGASSNRLMKVIEQVEGHYDSREAVQDVLTISGFSFSGAGQNAGLAFIMMKDWSERDLKTQSVEAEANVANGILLGGVKEGIAYSVVPPPIHELGDSSGFDMRLLDRTGMGYSALVAAKDRLLDLARQSPLLDPHSVRVSDLPEVQQIELRIDRQKAYAHKVSFQEISNTLAITFGSAFVNDFPNQGRMQRVIVQADSPFRMQPEDIMGVYVRNADGEMVPVSAFADYDWVYGPAQVVRYNGYPAMRISGSPSEGHSTGEAMAEMERLVAQLPGYSLEWTGQSLQEKVSGDQIPILLGLSMLVVFLLLAALYESWSIPLSVMLVVPLGILGCVVAVMMRGMPNDVFFKVGLITIIGLSAKNAILIVEFAKDLQRDGEPLIKATLHAARLRFRPILMTSFAFTLGVIPLAMAVGASSASQRAIGTGVIGGMIAATFLAIFLVPVFFVVVRKLFDRHAKV
jgi:multidrug efflux pump